MKVPLEGPAEAEGRVIPAEDMQLTRVGRRRESRLLALLSGAAVVFVAISVAKPWGESTLVPGPPASSQPPSAAASAPATPHAIPPDVPEATEITDVTEITFEPGGQAIWVCVSTPSPQAPIGPGGGSLRGGFQFDPSTAVGWMTMPPVRLSGGAGLVTMPPKVWITVPPVDPSAASGHTLPVRCSGWILMQEPTAGTP
jgi:hypothetical protein